MYEGGPVFSSAQFISECCVCWKFGFPMQPANSRDSDNKYCTQINEDPLLHYTLYYLFVNLKNMMLLFFKAYCAVVILKRWQKHTLKMKQMLLICKVTDIEVMSLQRTVLMWEDTRKWYRYQRTNFNSHCRKMHWNLENCTTHLAEIIYQPVTSHCLLLSHVFNSYTSNSHMFMYFLYTSTLHIIITKGSKYQKNQFGQTTLGVY